MRFKSESSNLIVWDKDKNKELCRFKDHEYETDDPYVIDRLGDYEVMGGGREEEQEEDHTEEKEEEEQEDKEQQVEDLRKEAKEKGIKNWHNMKPENLIAKLRGD